MGRSLTGATYALAVLTAGAALADNKLDETRTTLEKWVETRQLISRTVTEWQADKEMLTQTRQLFERELQAIQVQMSSLSTNNTQVEVERAQSDELAKASKASLEVSRQHAAELEAEILKLVPRLPEPLQEILKPLLNRIPADAAQTRATAAERLQVIVGILNEIDKFNSGVNIFNEKRLNAKGEEVAVDSIYIGLGVGYFVNATSELAGTGAPGPKGWEWTIDPKLGASLTEVIRIYRNERSARFIPLPVIIR